MSLCVFLCFYKEDFPSKVLLVVFDSLRSPDCTVYREMQIEHCSDDYPHCGWLSSNSNAAINQRIIVK